MHPLRTSFAKPEKSFTHQIFTSQPDTVIESVESFREFDNTIGQNELSGNVAMFGNTEFLLCKFFLTLIQNEEKLIEEKKQFIELRFDYE